jgi:hypothetical protein
LGPNELPTWIKELMDAKALKGPIPPYSSPRWSNEKSQRFSIPHVGYHKLNAKASLFAPELSYRVKM